MKRQKRQLNAKQAKIKKIVTEVDEVISSEAALPVGQPCLICESPEPDVTCVKCLQSFHSKCLDHDTTDDYVCQSCSSENHPCFFCRETTGETKQCSLPTCRKLYHSDCLKKLDVLDKDKFVCPLHACMTCKNSKGNMKSELVSCIRCPMAYHNTDECVAVGTKRLTKTSIVCSEHFTPVPGKSFQAVVNIPWCSHCSLPGELIHCISCPSAFHAKCVTVQQKGSFKCNDCISRKHCTYGSVVWVKIGMFRWWPAQIVKPKDLPKSTQKTDPMIGEFPVQYFGTKEYFWTYKTRIHPFFKVTKSEGITCSSTLETKYQLSVEEANSAFDKKVAVDSQSNVPTKPQYKPIRVNRPIGKVQIHVADVSELSRCTCDETKPNPCGYASGCLNRSMFVECHPDLCRSGDRCENQMFQKRQYPKLQSFQSSNRGWGLKTLDPIKAGHFIIEYIGDLIDEQECQKRLIEQHRVNDKNYYFLTIDKDRIIDAGPKGNLSRFMNHSCSPNCETQKWMVNGDTRVGLFAKHDIAAGSELTFDYMMDFLNCEKLKCHCGSPNCHGAIGIRSQRSRVAAKPKPKTKPKKQESKLTNRKICFLCNETGNLVSCDFPDCKKSYHMVCLKRDKVPSGRWQCPWHHCDTCGRLSQHMCSKCTSSFCDRHKTDQNMIAVLGSMFCSNHAAKDKVKNGH